MLGIGNLVLSKTQLFIFSILKVFHQENIVQTKKLKNLLKNATNNKNTSHFHISANKRLMSY